MEPDTNTQQNDGVSLTLGDQYGYGSSFELRDLDADAGAGNVVGIETAGFSDLNGAVPAEYRLDTSEVTKLITALVNILAQQTDSQTELETIVAGTLEDAIDSTSSEEDESIDPVQESFERGR